MASQELGAADAELTLEDIVPAYVPTRHPEAIEVEIGSEMVVVRTRAHALNPTAALVWQCFDGEGSIAEIVDDLAEATGAGRAVIEADVLALTRQLAASGLLEGIGGDVVAAMASPRPEPLPVGSELEPFSLASLEGDETALESFRGHDVLLVNWSPGCGFCTRIAGELADLQPTLAERDVALLFVTGGSIDANRKVFGDAGLTALAVMRRDGIDPFKGFGTPAAYLLDAQGRVAAPMALGADRVPDFARSIAGVVDDEAGPVAQYLPASGAVCGGGSGPAPGRGTDWKGTAAYRFGDVHAGIRYNRPSTEELLDRLFAGLRVDDDRAPDNYSVALYPPAPKGRTRELNLLVQGSRQLVRTRSTVRILQGLLAYLSADLAPGDPELLRVDAVALIGDGKAILGPTGMTGWIKQLQPRLARARLQLVDVPAVRVDARTAELVIPEPTVAHDPAALDGLDEGVNLGSELAPIVPGRYPLRAWFSFSPDKKRVGLLSPALAVAAAASHVSAPHGDLARVLGDLAGLMGQIEPIGIWFDGAPSLAKQLGDYMN